MIAIIDYDAGNIRSVINALERIGAKDYVLTADEAVIRGAERVILPGVGDASAAMKSLCERGLDAVVPTLKQPVLGICVGMQLMCLGSEEGNVRCMGIFPTEVKKFEATPELKVPHMGWNALRRPCGPLFEGVPDGSYVYFVHSYYASVCEATAAQCTHGVPLSAALSAGNFFGVQFHPEKSGPAGERILRNFCKL